MKVVFPTRDEFDQIIDEKLDKKFDEKLGKLPTKEEFFSRMDKLSGEYQKIDEAETLHAGTLSEQADAIEKLDQRVTVLEKRKSSSPVPVSSVL